jgi:HTH-type transcriptional regulator / antitoxin HipB
MARTSLKVPKATLYLMSISDALRALGARAQRLRLLQNVTQAELATNAGVGLKALRRFEVSGKGTLESAVRIAVALGAADAFSALFEAPAFNSLAEAEAQTAAATRRRARKKAS